MAALKELRELGFNVMLFERRSEVGGVWNWTDDRSMTTALKETRLCNSKFGVRAHYLLLIRWWCVLTKDSWR